MYINYLRTTVFDLFMDYIYLFEHIYSPTHQYVPLSSLGLVSGIKYRVMPKTFIISQLYMSYFSFQLYIKTNLYMQTDWQVSPNNSPDSLALP